MIYEKRGMLAPRVKREDVAAGDRLPVFCTAVPSVKEVYVSDDINDCIKKPSERRRTGRGKRFAAVVCVAALLFVLDARCFDSVCAKGIFSFIKDCAQIALYEDEGGAADNNGGFGERTLYTLSYSANEQNEASLEREITELPKDDAQHTVAADSNFSENFADGERLYPITSLDLSAPTFTDLNNETSFSPDMDKISHSNPPALSGIDAHDGPKVLILHTHGTETYTQNTDMYPESEETRSTDIQKNIVRAGEEIARTLSEFGVEAIHCSTMHDESSFINAYSYSSKTVKKYLEEYPSVRFVIDVHRDAIIKDDGESVKAVTNIAGEDYAQIMFVVGTNELGHGHPEWQDNLSLAVRLQKEIGESYPNLCRSINLRNVPFNQQLSKGYLLLEIGTCANTLEEALRSARAFGENLARVILKA